MLEKKCNKSLPYVKNYILAGFSRLISNDLRMKEAKLSQRPAMQGIQMIGLIYH